MLAKKIISLILNAIAVVAALIGLIIIRDSGAIVYYKYFTVLTNCMIMVGGLISIGYSIDYFLKKDKDASLPIFPFVVKLIAAVAALITFLTVVCFLQYQDALFNAKPDSILFWNNICHHYVAPLAFILGFILFDTERKYVYKTAFFGPMLVFLYSAYIVPICMINVGLIGDAPYPFLNPEIMPLWLLPIGAVLFLIVAMGLSFVLWVLNRICFYIFTGEEISKEEINAIEETPISKEEEKEIEAEIEEEKQSQEAGYKGPRIYHISKRREDSMWQVKFANGKKAIKLFDTQAEAIVFAKKLAKSQDGSIRVHSLKGRIRKSN